MHLNERKPLPFPEKQEESLYMRNRSLILKALLLTGITFIGVEHIDALADTVPTINEKAKELYFGKFIGVAKWIIAGKGGWDTLNKALKEDFEGAKKCFIQYLVIFCILLALPIALDFIEVFFRS